MPDAEGRFRVAIAGSGDFMPDDEIFASIGRMQERHPEGIVVLVKDEAGVATSAWQMAALHGLPYEILPAEEADDFDHKVGATSAHNARLVAKADTLIAFFHPGPTSDLALTSSGTMNAIYQAGGAKVPVFVFHEGGWTVGGPPRAPMLPPDGWHLPKGYRAGPTTSTCGNTRRAGCGAEILWSESPNGRRIPLNNDGSSHLDTCPIRAKERRYG